MCFWRLFFQNKNYCHSEFLVNLIIGQSFIILKKLRYRGQLLLELSILLLFSIEYCLDQLNNNHTRIEVNLKGKRFETHYQWKCLVKPLRF